MKSFCYKSSRNILILKIKLQLMKKNYANAETLVKSALSVSPSDPKLLDLAQDVFTESQNWDEIYQLHRRIELLNPNNLNLKLYLGNVLFASYKYDEAVEKFKYCVENWNLGDRYAETLANVYGRLAISYAYLEKWDFAELALHKAMESDIWDPDIACAYVLCALGRGKADTVIDYLDQEIKLHPRLHTLYLAKAFYIEFFLHNTNEALNYYVKSLHKINSFQFGRKYRKYYLSTGGYAIPWYILRRVISACVRTGKVGQAYLLIWLTKFLIWDSEINLQIFTVYIAVLKNSLHFAEKECRTMLRKNISVFSRVEYLSLLAQIHFKKERYDDAISTMKLALALNLYDLENWISLGSFQLQKSDSISAIDTYQTVLKMNPFDFRSWTNLASCYVNIGDLVSAKSSYEKAIHLNPFEANAWVDLANVHLKLGNRDAARSSYQMGVKYDWLDRERRNQAIHALKELT